MRLLPILVLATSLLLPASVFAAPQAAETPTEASAERLRQEMNDPALYLELIAALQQRRLHYAALAHLDMFDTKWPNDRRAMLQRADAWRQIDELDRAGELYRRLLASEPLAGAYHGLGLIAVRRGAPGEGLELLAQANRLAPIDVRILNDLGYLQLTQQQYPAARLSLNKAVELAPANPQAVANLALYHLLTGSDDKAEQLMQHLGFDQADRERIRADAQRLRGQ